MKDKDYMFRAIELARKGEGHTAPNPMVGAVVVCEGHIIGEGYHRRYGEPHAEANAIRAVSRVELLSRSTLYVNLEPCSHYGKTPPCARLILDSGIPRVVVGSIDPFPEVAGRGIAMLREGGVEVVTGVAEAECEELNKRFFTFHRKRRPYIILKWAQTADGFIDRLRRVEDGLPPARISTELSMMAVHRLRAQEAAILVGTNTALLDNPRLTVRHWRGANPVRIAIDRHRRIPKDYHLFDGEAETLLFTEKAPPTPQRGEWCAYRQCNFIKYPPEEGGGAISFILDELYRRRLLSLVVEGGGELLQSFIDCGLYDEVQVEVSPERFGEGVKAPTFR